MDKKYEDYSFENDLGYDEYLWYRDHPEEAKKEKEYEFDEWQKQAIMDGKADQEGRIVAELEEKQANCPYCHEQKGIINTLDHSGIYIAGM